jgi:hypothetical protein
MQTTLIVFVVVTSLAVVIQAGILVALFAQMRKMNEKFLGVTDEVRTSVLPIINRMDDLTREVRPQIAGIVSDASEMVSLARGQAQKMDRLLTEALDRTRLQLIHVDQMLTGALETIDEAGSSIRRTLSTPVRQATALIRGIQTGLEVLRTHRRPAAEDASGESSDEGLFI